MKVLAVMGSPRKGDSYKLTQIIEKKLREKGDVEFEYLFLKDVNLEQCIGCHACITKGEDKCPLKDDRAKLEENMMNADGIIFVSPVYNQHVTGLMKNFLDRFAYSWHRPRFFGKKVMGIATGGGYFKETLGYLETNAKYLGFEFVNKLGVPHMEALTPKYKLKMLKDIDKEVEIFYKALKDNKLPVPGIGDLMRFGMWKTNAIACRESLPCDYPYWNEKGWLDKEYYYDTKINIFKKIIVSGLGIIGKWYMHRMYIGY